MIASIVWLPVARKRGRKMTKGPKAEIVPLCSQPRRAVCSDAPEVIASDALAESFADKERALLDRIRAQELERIAQREAWLDISRNVIRFPDAARFRSVALVCRLLDGGDEIEPEVPERSQQLLAEIAARRAAIVALATGESR